ncbi:zinc metallopeptidase [Lagierella sp.]|uniref:zinc metallopeptidase n=1 Tax=Lagierella sp. TaxID=2849657 RepID=UPI002628A4B4|nr:zinc metallopeptidase [Lagierella sp.]
MYGNLVPYYGDGSWMILVFAAMILGLIAQAKIKSTYAKYKEVQNSKRITGAQAARYILDRNGLQDVKIQSINGELTDHYDPTQKVIRLSQDVYSGDSVSAVSIAAHEVGHAIQHGRGYSFLNFRNALVPVVNIASRSIYTLFILGIFFAPIFLDIAIAIFAVTVLFQVITLPVEINASSRALNNLEEGILQREELGQGKKVLSAAAMTYIAAALFSIAQLGRLLQRRNR